MMRLKRWRAPLAELLEPAGVSAETMIAAEVIMRPIQFWREHPDVAIAELTGTVSMPHQRLMLHQAHRGAAENHFTCSRGTAKTSTIDAQYATYKAIFYAKRKGVQISLSGFRGGQMGFNDIEKWLLGGWDSQKADVRFYEHCVAKGAMSKSIIHKSQNYWQIRFKSFSELTTLPTNDPDKIRGIRGHDLYPDEANMTQDDELIEKVARPFLNVLGDFEHGGAQAERNAIYYTTTVDYSWRPYLKSVKSARDGVQRDYEAHRAERRGDWQTYDELAARGLHEYTLTVLDYTDTVMRREVTMRDGRRFRMTWPNPKLEWEYDPRGIPFSERDAEGEIKKEGTPQELLRTYAINKLDIERAILDGSTDESMWLGEQRNKIDTATGDVYPYALIEKMSHAGDRCLVRYGKTDAAFQERYAADERDYSPTIMWTCEDPCVMAVDYAGGNRDFCAYVVMRIGPMAEGEFAASTGQGRTSWSNVIWCEQHRLTSHGNAAEKIQQLRERYNIAYFYDPVEKDTWKLCRGIGLDMRGGGSGVRDALAHIDDAELEADEYRIIDPLDDDPRILAFMDDPKTIPLLDAIVPSDTLNEKCVEYTLGEMKAGRLYLPAWVNPSDRQDAPETEIAYNASKLLLHQLRKIQQEPTQRARRFYMPGNKTMVENKKDLFSSFLYAGKQLRAHLIRFNTITDAAPAMGAARTKIKRKYHGRTPGTRAVG